MSLVEDAYRQAVDVMTPAEKLAWMHELLNWARDLYARQLREKLAMSLQSDCTGKWPCVNPAAPAAIARPAR